jgi:hypothetical protein
VPQHSTKKQPQNMTSPDFVNNFSFDFAKVQSNTSPFLFWRTVLVNEPIQNGSVGHLEMPVNFDICKKLFVGAIEGGNEHDHVNIIGRGGSTNGKAISFESGALYSKDHQDDQGGFKLFHGFVGATDRIGIFYDMRDPNNGCMFLTYDGEMRGQLFSGLKGPLYPAISYNTKFLKNPTTLQTSSR